MEIDSEQKMSKMRAWMLWVLAMERSVSWMCGWLWWRVLNKRVSWLSVEDRRVLGGVKVGRLWKVMEGRVVKTLEMKLEVVVES